MYLFSRSRLRGVTVVCLIASTALYFFMSPDDLQKKHRRKYSISPRQLYNSSQLYSRPPPPQSCTCYPGALMLKSFVPKKKYQAMRKRRDLEFKKYKRRIPTVLTKPLFASANSPLQFPISGFTVRPLTRTHIPGLGLFAGRSNIYKVLLKTLRGILTTNVTHDEAKIVGGNSKKFAVQSRSLAAVNLILSNLFYSTTGYVVNNGDLVSIQFEEHEGVIPVAIKQPQIPILWDMGTDINSQVTITIKTFMRYDKLRLLLTSIRRFYPDIPIIIADDSYERETIAEDNVEQHFMPPGKGWFAGRNLAISQVTTKYFFWVDDDFLFTRHTKIEKFLEVMEANPRLDVVGGAVEGELFRFTIGYEDGMDSEGGCMHLNFERRFQTLPGYPQCSVVNGVINLFLGRTDAVQKAGFDPKFQRIGHREVFMDGLGSLMVASCKDFSNMHIAHQSHLGDGSSYNKFRYRSEYNRRYRFPIFYFKHNLKCLLFDKKRR